jgi:hypothetical protein
MVVTFWRVFLVVSTFGLIVMLLAIFLLVWTGGLFGFW